MFTRAISIAVAAGLLAGCATDPKVAEAARKSMRSVRLAEIKAPPKPTVFTGVGAGSLLPLLELALNRDGQTLDAASPEARGKRMAEVVGEEFTTHFSAVRAFPALTRSAADAKLELEITDYGLFPGGSSMSKTLVRAQVAVSATLVLANGKVAWSDSERGSDDASFDLPDFLESPSFTRERFRRAAEQAVLKLLQDMDTQMGYDAADAIAAQRKAVDERVASHEKSQKEKLAALLAEFAAAPREGDTWTYRLTEPQRDAAPRQRPYVVKAAAVSAGAIRDELLLDGKPAGTLNHRSGSHLIVQGRSLYSPYLPFLAKASAGMGEERVAIDDPACNPPYQCIASGRFIGLDEVSVPGGTFDAIRIRILLSRLDQTARHVSSESSILTVWYSPKAKRAVKFANAAGGQTYPGEGDFLLELVSYRPQ
jgi:hypothetical protein